MLKKELNTEERKKILLNILDVFSNFCKTYNLKYSLAFGTALGAIRHGGFIPWDDDIDVWMPRNDYQKMIKLWKHKQYKLHCCEKTKRYYYLFSKICDAKTFSTHDPYLKENFGIFIDVFPIDSITKIKYEKEKDNIEFNVLRLFTFNKKIIDDVNMHKSKIGSPLISKSLAYIKVISKRVLGTNYFYHKVLKILKKVRGNEYCVCSCTASSKYYFSISIFENLCSIKFENLNVLIFKNYDEILTKIYGNYMILPPIEERVLPHHYHYYFK